MAAQGRDNGTLAGQGRRASGEVNHDGLSGNCEPAQACCDRPALNNGRRFRSTGDGLPGQGDDGRRVSLRVPWLAVRLCRRDCWVATAHPAVSGGLPPHRSDDRRSLVMMAAVAVRVPGAPVLSDTGDGIAMVGGMGLEVNRADTLSVSALSRRPSFIPERVNCHTSPRRQTRIVDLGPALKQITGWWSSSGARQ